MKDRIRRLERATGIATDDEAAPVAQLFMGDARTLEDAHGEQCPAMPNDPRSVLQVFDGDRVVELEAEGLGRDEALRRAAEEFGQRTDQEEPNDANQ